MNHTDPPEGPRPRMITHGCMVILFASLIVAVGYAIIIAAILAKWQPGHQEEIYKAFKRQTEEMQYVTE